MTTSTRTVQNRLLKPDLSPIVGQRVTIRLNGSYFADDGTSETMDDAYVYTDATGLWQCPDLPVNTSGFYTAREKNGTIWSFSVPADTSPDAPSDPGTPIWLFDCLVTDPPDLPPGVPLATAVRNAVSALFDTPVTA